MSKPRCPVGPNWLIEGTHVTRLGGSARDRAESKCCGDAPGTCAECPLIVQRMVRHECVVHPSTRLTANSAERKATPIATGVLDYFPLALAAVARLSKKGNDKHIPGEPLHWSRGKSTDHADCIARHLIERGTVESESGELHEACLAWRALALLQLAEEKRLAILPPGV